MGHGFHGYVSHNQRVNPPICVFCWEKRIGLASTTGQSKMLPNIRLVYAAKSRIFSRQKRDLPSAMMDGVVMMDGVCQYLNVLTEFQGKSLTQAHFWGFQWTWSFLWACLANPMPQKTCVVGLVAF